MNRAISSVQRVRYCALRSLHPTHLFLFAIRSTVHRAQSLPTDERVDMFTSEPESRTMENANHYSYIDPRLLMKHTGAGFENPLQNSTAPAYAQDILSTQTRLSVGHAPPMTPCLLPYQHGEFHARDLASRVSAVTALMGSHDGQESPSVELQQQYLNPDTDCRPVAIGSPAQPRIRKRSYRDLTPMQRPRPRNEPAGWDSSQPYSGRDAASVATKDRPRHPSRTARQRRLSKAKHSSISMPVQHSHSPPLQDPDRPLLPNQEISPLDTGYWLTQTHNVGYSEQLLPQAALSTTGEHPAILPIPLVATASNNSPGGHFCDVDGCEYHQKYGKPFSMPSALAKHQRTSHGPKIYFCLEDSCEL